MVCVMCNAEIKTSKPILTMSDTLFLPNGRWEEHLTVDSLCSMDCMKTLLQEKQKRKVAQDCHLPKLLWTSMFDL